MLLKITLIILIYPLLGGYIKIGIKRNMTRRFTQKNKAGVKGRSTLITSLEKMKMIRKQCTTTQRLAHKYDYEKGLNNMAKWLVAATKCPPRHYGKVWNDEKEVVVRQCQALYEEMQKFATYQADSFMGDHAKRTIQHIPISRLRYNVATAKWDFTNSMTPEKNQYWNEKANVPGKVKHLKRAQMPDGFVIQVVLDQHERDMERKYVSFGPKVTNTIMDWRLANGFK